MKTLIFFATILLSAPMALAATAEVHLTVKDSKILFVQKVDSFEVITQEKNSSETFSCLQKSIFLDIGYNLLDGWNPKDFTFADYEKHSTSGPSYGQYAYSICRDGKTQVTLWYQDQKSMENYTAEFWGEISYFFIQDDFDNIDHELFMEKRDLLTGNSKYFSCQSPIERTQINETDKYIAYDVSASCKEIKKRPPTGLIDFINNPGVFAAANSYRSVTLPALASTPENFKKVTTAFLNKIPQGKYSGIMKSGNKTCDLEINLGDDKLTIKHIITTGEKPRTRVLEFTPGDLLGFTEGDVYEDPNRVEETAQGQMSAAEFINQKNGESIWIRFEKNDNREGQILRINGSEAYCRRLQAQ